MLTWTESLVVKKFHKLYYDGPKQGGQIFQRTYWRGVQCLKCPTDLMAYQEIIHETRPDLIIETGTCHGGSALFLADMLTLEGCGEVITVDLIPRGGRPEHPRITYVEGSSSDPGVIASVFEGRPRGERVMAILDSDHSKGHVLAEMRLIAPHVSVGCYLIVEDTNVNGHPVFKAHGPGPYEAAEEFLSADERFEVDRSREKYLMTFNPSGFLRRVR